MFDCKIGVDTVERPILRKLFGNHIRQWVSKPHLPAGHVIVVQRLAVGCIVAVSEWGLPRRIPQRPVVQPALSRFIVLV